MSNKEVLHTLNKIDQLFTEMRKSFSLLVVQINSVDIDAHLTIDQFTELPNSGGLMLRKMPNLNEDLYSVVEVMGNSGASASNVCVQQQVVINVMRGVMNLRIVETGEWIRLSPNENTPFTLKPCQVHDYIVLEDIVNVNLFTPPLP